MDPSQLKRLLAQRAAARSVAATEDQNQPESFRRFNASELYCPKCRRAMPVREKLLLTLPHGNLYDYLCTGCGTSLGTKQA